MGAIEFGCKASRFGCDASPSYLDPSPTEKERVDQLVTIQTSWKPLGGQSIPSRWPDVARVPDGPRLQCRRRSPTGSSAARRARATDPGGSLPDGTVIGAADPTLLTMVVHRPEALVRRVGRYGLIGFGESYMAGDWSSNDLAGLLTEFGKSVPS